MSGAFVDKNVGANKPVQISGLLLNGANAGNYILTQPITTASITRAALTVSATNRSKVYGQAAAFGGNEFVVSGAGEHGRCDEREFGECGELELGLEWAAMRLR